MAADSENVAEEIQQEEVVQSSQQEHAEESQAPEASEQQKEISDKEKNFLRLRETKEQLERENRELKDRMQKYSQPQEEEEDDLGISDDDIPEGKHVRKLYNELRTLRKAYEQDKVATIPDRLKSKFSDFEQVVTPENVEKLKQTEPELYASITSGSDLYAKGVSAYKTLKAMGIVKEDPYKAQKKEVHDKHSKPLSAQAIKGQGALSDANLFAKGLTPELRKQLQKEMSEALKAR